MADIAAPNAFDSVFKKYGADIKVVLHTASPVSINTKEYEKDLLIPAVNGTKSILEAIKKYAADGEDVDDRLSSSCELISALVRGKPEPRYLQGCAATILT